MNEIQELRYLMELMLSATRWVRETEDSPTGLELEIQDRIQKLTSVPTDRLIGPGDPDGTNPRERRIKVKMPDGSWKRFYESELDKVPCKASHTGFKWVPKAPETQV